MNASSADTKRNEHRLRYKSTSATFHSSLHVRPDDCGERERERERGGCKRQTYLSRQGHIRCCSQEFR